MCSFLFCFIKKEKRKKHEICLSLDSLFLVFFISFFFDFSFGLGVFLLGKKNKDYCLYLQSKKEIKRN